MRALVANLDCELRWAQAMSPGPHKELPSAVRKAVSELSLEMKIFGRADDTFLDLTAIANAGPAPLRDVSEVLVWGQTALHTGKPAPTDETAPWQERLWQLVCTPAIAAQCNDRRFCLDLELPPAVELACVQTIGSLEALDHYIATAPLGPDESWVAKAPWSASGRERLKRRGRVVQGEQRAFAERLLRRYGELVIEPWMLRIADFGTAGLIGESLASSIMFPAHQLLCDAGGVFRGIRIDDAQTRSQLGPHADALDEAVALVMARLHSHGYRGPFGIDSFLYESREGPRLRAVCEINARMSFGLVARARAEAAQQLTSDFAPGW